MENKKKMILQMYFFSFSCLCGNNLWSIPWGGFE